MNDRTEHPPYRELDDDERYYATAPVDEIRYELEHCGVRVEPATAVVRALINECTPVVRAVSASRGCTLDPETTYIEHLGLIERIASSIAWRRHLTADETAELVQVARVRLFENDYAIIRKFEGRSSFSTYLTTVIVRLFNEWRVAEWGKWAAVQRVACRGMGEMAAVRESKNTGG
jgi:hypothetical protein